jgi:hypothetical protein
MLQSVSFALMLKAHLLGAWPNYSSTDNGGPPGVLYELLVASFYYCFVAASIAEVWACDSTLPNSYVLKCLSWCRPFLHLEASTIGPR